MNNVFSYITEDNKLPQNRNAVYFCSHPDDIKKYLRCIADEIFKIQPGSVIWYNGMTVKFDDEEKYRMALRDIKKFIVIVTEKFLEESNSGLEDFRFAMSEHIPVLPIIQDDKLVEKFNRVCGRIHFLDNNNKNMTYEYSMERFFKVHKYGKELEQKVKEAFCTFVFLSYRKKDYYIAKKLMSLIHEKEELVDVGIWYDEFLVAGEKFDEVIKNTIDQSAIVVLAVTPRLLEEGNYIQKIEFPYAKGIKNIIPIEMEETDQNKLKKMYEGIPLCIKATSGDILAVLEFQLKKIAVKHKLNHPWYKYLLGIAYLNGIYVESNFERGVKYILEAVQFLDDTEQILEVNKQLSDMYFWGKGVSIDYIKAANYQILYVKYLDLKAENITDKEELIRELFWLVEICRINPKDPDDKASSRMLSARIVVDCYRNICDLCEDILEIDFYNMEIVKFYAVCSYRVSSVLRSSLQDEKEYDYAIISESYEYAKKYLNVFERYPEIEGSRFENHQSFF